MQTKKRDEVTTAQAQLLDTRRQIQKTKVTDGDDSISIFHEGKERAPVSQQRTDYQRRQSAERRRRNQQKLFRRQRRAISPRSAATVDRRRQWHCADDQPAQAEHVLWSRVVQSSAPPAIRTLSTSKALRPWRLVTTSPLTTTTRLRSVSLPRRTDSAARLFRVTGRRLPRRRRSMRLRTTSLRRVRVAASASALISRARRVVICRRVRECSIARRAVTRKRTSRS